MIAPGRVDCALGRGHVQASPRSWFSVRSAMSAAAARLRNGPVPRSKATATDRRCHHGTCGAPGRRTRCESSACVVASFSESSMRVCSPFLAHSAHPGSSCSQTLNSRPLRCRRRPELPGSEHYVLQVDRPAPAMHRIPSVPDRRADVACACGGACSQCHYEWASARAGSVRTHR